MLRLSTAVVAQLRAWASAGHPSETCGLLFARGAEDVAVRALQLDNVADKLHALDPAAYPRTSRAWFEFNVAKAARLVREAEAGGERWLAIWHSHIDCGAYFSAEDIAAAAPDGQCVYPQLYQLVISVRAAGCDEARAFRWDGSVFAADAVFPGFTG